jgi:hypothetical protein
MKRGAGFTADASLCSAPVERQDRYSGRSNRRI